MVSRTLRLDPELDDALQALAAKTGTSIADLMRRAATALVASKCKRCGGTGREKTGNTTACR